MEELEKLYNFVFKDYEHGIGCIVIILLLAELASKLVPKKIIINLFKSKQK